MGVNIRDHRGHLEFVPWGSVSFPHKRLERTQWGLTDLEVFVGIIQFCFCDAKATVNNLLKIKKKRASKE